MRYSPVNGRLATDNLPVPDILFALDMLLKVLGPCTLTRLCSSSFRNAWKMAIALTAIVALMWMGSAVDFWLELISFNLFLCISDGRDLQDWIYVCYYRRQRLVVCAQVYLQMFYIELKWVTFFDLLQLFNRGGKILLLNILVKLTPSVQG